MEITSYWQLLPLAVLLGTVFYVIQRSSKSRLNEPPFVPYKLPVLGHTLDMQFNLEGTIQKCIREYGDVFTLYYRGILKTVATGEAMYEAMKSDRMSLAMSLEESIPTFTALNLDLYPALSFWTEFVRDRIIARLDVYRDRVFESLKLGLDKEIGSCEVPKVIEEPIPVIQRIITHALANMFLGEELCKDEELVHGIGTFAASIMKVTMTMPWIALLHPKLAKWKFVLMFRYGPPSYYRRLVYRKLKPVVESRLQDSKVLGKNWNRPEDLLQDLIEENQKLHSSKHVDVNWIVAHMLGLFFPGTHTTTETVVCMLYDLAARQEYYSPLLKEQEEVLRDDGKITVEVLGKMRKLDSFLRESMRLSAQRVAYDHAVIADKFTFSNGYEIPYGRDVVFVMYKANEDEQTHKPNPSEFDGFRHLSTGATTAKVDRNFLIFGFGKHACPGRQFAIAEVKMIASIILQYYHVRTSDGKRPPYKQVIGITLPSDGALIFEQRTL